MPDLVVLIATRNRWPLLEACLESLQAQDAPPASVAIRVVDNGSTDGSAERLRDYVARSRPIPVEAILHPIAGKSIALNRGLEGLDCQVVAFSDDDMRPDRRWLAAIWDHLQQCTCAGLHGRVALDLPGAPPSWFTDTCAELLGATVRRQPGDPVYALQGANMAVRACQARRIGSFREDLGPRGRRYGSAEDIEWSHRLVEHGESLCYRPEVLSYHVVGAERLTPCALWARQFEYARRETVEGLQDSARPGLGAELRALIGALLRRKRRFSGMDYGLELARRLGHVVGRLGRWAAR